MRVCGVAVAVLCVGCAARPLPLPEATSDGAVSANDDLREPPLDLGVPVDGTSPIDAAIPDLAQVDFPVPDLSVADLLTVDLVPPGPCGEGNVLIG
jgi:hypothetical protein